MTSVSYVRNPAPKYYTDLAWDSQYMFGHFLKYITYPWDPAHKIINRTFSVHYISSWRHYSVHDSDFPGRCLQTKSLFWLEHLLEEWGYEQEVEKMFTRWQTFFMFESYLKVGQRNATLLLMARPIKSQECETLRELDFQLSLVLI